VSHGILTILSQCAAELGGKAVCLTHDQLIYCAVQVWSIFVAKREEASFVL